MTTTTFTSTSADIMDRMEKQIAFLMEIDRLKHIYRQTYLLDKSRHDSDVEHSWHFAVMAMVLSEYAKDSIDVCKVMKMALIHDIVEIDAGDVFVYDRKDGGDHYAMEQAAAKRIFGMLPADQAKEYIALWEEFEKARRRRQSSPPRSTGWTRCFTTVIPRASPGGSMA